MRLIDADKLIDDLSDLMRSPWANPPWASDQRELGIREALDMIQSIVRVDSQTIDSVPVIRCKDCKYSTDEYGDGDCYCDLSVIYIGKDWNHFCSWAARKEE